MSQSFNTRLHRICSLMLKLGIGVSFSWFIISLIIFWWWGHFDSSSAQNLINFSLKSIVCTFDTMKNIWRPNKILLNSFLSPISVNDRSQMIKYLLIRGKMPTQNLELCLIFFLNPFEIQRVIRRESKTDSYSKDLLFLACVAFCVITFEPIMI